jgi:probable phosphoglycerate mutase
MGRLVKSIVADQRPWTVVSSPLGRAYQTARIVCEEAGYDGKIETDERLAEVSVGDFEGLTRDEILALAPQTEIGPGWLFNTPGGESEAQLKARLAAWLAEIDMADGRRRVVVSHGVAGKMLRHLYAGEPVQGATPPQDSVFMLVDGRIERLEG